MRHTSILIGLCFQVSDIILHMNNPSVEYQKGVKVYAVENENHWRGVGTDDYLLLVERAALCVGLFTKERITFRKRFGT